MNDLNPDTWHEVFITDKTGKRSFCCLVSPMSTMSEIRNLKRHIEQAKANPSHYKFLDIDTAVIMLDNTVYGADDVTDIDDILKKLGL